VSRSKRTGTAAFLNEIRQTLWSVSPNSPVAEVRTLEEIYRKSMGRTSFTLVMLAIAGAMASYFPARRASAVNPVESLRVE
jgi:putative ABC transport system permease protein